MVSALDIQNKYLEYMDDTESPTLFHRWCFISGVSALLERNLELKLGHLTVYPNQYVVLLGESATRKSSAILAMSKLLADLDYRKFAGDKSSKEKFIQDLSSGFDLNEEAKEINTDLTNYSIEEILNTETNVNKKPDVAAAYIKAGELKDFLGQNNTDFITWLVNIWDNLPYYDNRVKNGECDRINKPTVNLLGGATVSSFSNIFPLDILEDGMLSRILLVSGEGRRKKIPFPSDPPEKLKNELLTLLAKVKQVSGSVTIEPEAKDTLAEIYKTWQDIPDARFASYTGRRFDHLLKLCMVNAALRLSTEINLDDAILANTILSYTETLMPKALGEFGKNDDSRLATLLFNKIKRSPNGITGADLRDAVAGETINGQKISAIVDQLKNLGKIDTISTLDETGTTKVKFIPLQIYKSTKAKYTKFSILKEYNEARALQKEAGKVQLDFGD